jgi:hypothetical protein
MSESLLELRHHRFSFAEAFEGGSRTLWRTFKRSGHSNRGTVASRIVSYLVIGSPFSKFMPPEISRPYHFSPNTKSQFHDHFLLDRNNLF